jgi:uncharacterized protein involved in outer membrane biogenesis
MSWKKALALVTIALLLVLAGIVWWVFHYDFNRLKPLVVKQVRAATGRELTIGGDLRLKISLSPTLVTGPVKLRNAEWGSQPDMLTVQTLELQISLPALIHKDVVLKRLVLTKPVVLVEEKTDGSRNNWEFEELPSQQPAPSQTASEDYQIQLQEVDVQDGTLLYRNDKTRKTTRLNIAKLTLQRQEGPLPLKMAMEAAYDRKTFSLEGGISWLHDLFDTQKDWSFDLAAKADQTDLSITGRMHQPSGEKPLRIEAKISGTSLDVRPWLTDSSGKDTPPKNPKRVFPATPLPFDVLRDMDLEVELDIQELLTPHIALHQVKAPIQIQDGRLEVGPARATAGGGDYQAHVQIDTQTKPPTIKNSLKIDQMNAELMLKELGLGDIMEGVLDIQAELESRGQSVAELMGGLNGHVTLVSGKGRLGKLFFGLIDQGLARQMITLLNPLQKRSDTTPIDCLVIRFDSTNGLAQLSHLIWVTPDSVVVGGGHIDLASETIDIGIQPTPRQGHLSLGSLTKPFRLGGTLAAPSLRVDATATAKVAGQIAGGLLFGPVGIAMAFSEMVGIQGGNPCVAAVEAAKKGVVPEEKGFLENLGDKLRFWRSD